MGKQQYEKKTADVASGFGRPGALREFGERGARLDWENAADVLYGEWEKSLRPGGERDNFKERALAGADQFFDLAKKERLPFGANKRDISDYFKKEPADDGRPQLRNPPAAPGLWDIDRRLPESLIKTVERQNLMDLETLNQYHKVMNTQFATGSRSYEGIKGNAELLVHLENGSYLHSCPVLIFAQRGNGPIQQRQVIAPQRVPLLNVIAPVFKFKDENWRAGGQWRVWVMPLSDAASLNVNILTRGNYAKKP